jgi:hypothetical protein
MKLHTVTLMDFDVFTDKTSILIFQIFRLGQEIRKYYPHPVTSEYWQLSFYTHAHMNAHARTRTPTLTPTPTHARTHARTRAHTHTHTHTHT